MGGTTYKGLEGMAQLAGDIFGKIAGWFLDLFTGIAELITNPHETLAKLQVKIESFFLGIADMLGRVFDKFFNMEFILSLLPQWMVPDSLQEKVSKERMQEKQKRIKQLDQDDINLENRVAFAKKKLEEEQKKETTINEKGEEEGGPDSTKLRNLTLAIERAKMDLEANKESKKYLKETMAASAENVIQEKLNQKIKQITGVDNQVELEKIQKAEEAARELRQKDFDTGVAGSWDFQDMNLAAAAKIQKQIEALTGEEMSFKTDPFSKRSYGDAGVDVEFIKSVEGQQLITEMIAAGQVEQGFGSAGEEADAVRVMNLFFGRTMAAQKQAADDEKKAIDLQAKLDKIKLDKLAAVGGEKALRATISAEVLGIKKTGGPIHQTGLYKLHGGELVMDNAAVNLLAQTTAVASRMNLMNLQRDTNAETMQGSSAPIVISNAPSTTQINQSQAMILPPSPIQPGNSEAPRLLN